MALLVQKLLPVIQTCKFRRRFLLSTGGDDFDYADDIDYHQNRHYLLLIQPLDHFTNQPTALHSTESLLFFEVMQRIMNEPRFAFSVPRN
jgi:hypothetical protein